LLGDWRAWRRALVQSVVFGVILVLVAAGGRALSGPLLRLVTRTPEPLLAACAALDIVPERALVTGWAEIGATQSWDLAEVALRAIHVLAGRDLEYGPALSSPEDPADSVAEYTVSAPGVVYRSRARLMGGAADTAQLYLVCSVELQRPTSIGPVQERARAALHTLGRGAIRREPVYATVFARLDVVLDESGQAGASKLVESRLRGREVHVYQGAALHSLLSYSAMLGPTVPVAGRQVNLSVVLRPDPEGECTWVVIGTPLCAGDY